MRLIDADVAAKMIQRARSHGGNWYNPYTYPTEFLFAETLIANAPTVDAIPVEWIKKYEKTDDLAASIYRMLEACGVDMSDD